MKISWMTSNPILMGYKKFVRNAEKIRKGIKKEIKEQFKKSLLRII